MTDIAIIGAGGFGRETAWLIQQIGHWNLIGFFDDDATISKQFPAVKLLGPVSQVQSLPRTTALVVAIANPAIRQNIVQQIGHSFIFPTLVHPNAQLGHESNKLGQGCIVTAGVILTTSIQVGEFSILNLGTTIGHDTVLSAFTSIMPQCSISGNVQLGHCCFIGAGARILQNISLGDDCIVGAGAVVTKSFGNATTLVGVPAKEMD